LAVEGIRPACWQRALVVETVDHQVHVLSAVLVRAGCDARQRVADDEDALLPALAFDLAHEVDDQLRAVL